MAINLTKSYLDLARMVHSGSDGSVDPTIVARGRGEEERSIAAFEAIFALVAAEFVFSHSALIAFTSGQLRQHWPTLHQEYPDYESFDDLMKGEFRQIKPTLNKLTDLLGLERLNTARRKEWQQLHQFVKVYRDFMVHPTPTKYSELSSEIMSKKWNYASSTVTEILRYFYGAKGGTVPVWVDKGSLSIEGNILAERLSD
jgi:hypothetical protein